MKIFLLICWRNIWRHKRRSIVVISSIGLGVFAMLISVAVINGMMVQMVDNTISTSLGHVAIHRAGFQDNMKLENNFHPDTSIYEALKKNALIVASAPRVKVQGMVRSSESSRGVLVVGIDPARERPVSKMYDYTSKEKGSAFLDDPAKDDILISKTLADRLELGIGDKLVLMIQDFRNEIVGVGLTVKGTFRTPVEAFDKNVVFVGIKRLQKITELGENISEITVIAKSKDEVDAVKKYLLSKLKAPQLEILSWKDMAPNLVNAVKLFDAMMYIFFMIVFITIIFSIANTLVMSIMERFHEIGVMKSIGTRPSLIFAMVIFEAFNLGAVGLAAGLAAGGALGAVFSAYGIDLSFFMAAMRTWGTGSVIYPVIRAADVFISLGITIATTLLAALYPAVKAARIKPLEALHYI